MKLLPSIPAASSPRGSYFCFHEAIPFSSLKWYNKDSEPLSKQQKQISITTIKWQAATSLLEHI